MESKLYVIGNQDSVIYYNINKQFSNLNKIVITKEIILNSFESSDLRNLFEVLKTTKPENYISLIEQSDRDGIFNLNLVSDLYSKIQEVLPKLSQALMDVKLENFNFMNSVSNSNLTISLKTPNQTISKYYQEKGNILHAIKSLIKEYLFNQTNKFFLSELDNFQIEIYESEEIYKQVLLKKESNILQLYSGYGFSYSLPFDYFIGGEFYYSVGEDFTFYKNNQISALLRDKTKLIEKEINSPENILDNNELIILNDITKNIDDALIEVYINNKGNVRINNIFLLNNSLYLKSENGFFINKSSNNYNKIAILSLRDDLYEDSSNPKYLLIKSNQDVKYLMENLIILENVDGLIFNQNFYVPYLDKLASKLNIDIIFYKKLLNKTLEATLNLEELEINIENNLISDSNPFSNIISKNNNLLDSDLDYLNSVDLSTPNPAKRGNIIDNEINQLASSIISSPNSSLKSTSNQILDKDVVYNNKKKSAIDFLVDCAMEGPKKNISNNLNDFDLKSKDINSNSTSNNDDFSQISSSFQKEEILKEKVNYNQIETNDVIKKKNKFNSLDNSNNFFDESSLNKFNSNSNYFNNLEKNKQTNLNNNTNDFSKLNKNNNLIFIENILATNIITPFNITQSKSIFLKSLNSIEEIEEKNKEFFYFNKKLEQVQNNQFYSIISVEDFNNNSSINFDYLIINFPAEYFLLSKQDFLRNKIILNLTNMDKKIGKNILFKLIEELKKFSVVILKEDLNLIIDYIENFENIFVTDLISNEDFLSIKEKILIGEKKYILSHLKN